MPPIGKKKAMELVAKGELPFTFRSPHPVMAMVVQDEKFRIRKLVIDTAEAKAAAAKEMARSGMWLPEMYFSLRKPTGEIVLEASTKEEFLSQIEKIDWPQNW